MCLFLVVDSHLLLTPKRETLQMDTLVSLVKDFTEGSNRMKCPDTPRKLTPTEVENVLRNVISECKEMLNVTHDNPTEVLHRLVDEAKNPKISKSYYSSGKNEHENNVRIIAEQADAMVDATIYMTNMACKAGINLSPIAHAVAHANLRKRDPKTGQYLFGAYDTVIKPEGYVPANIEKVVGKMVEVGSWNVPYDYDKGEPDQQ